MNDFKLMQRVSICKYILYPALILFALEGLAEVIDLAPFEVTGSRIPGVSGTDTVITIGPEDLEISNPASVWDAFNGISGIQVEQSAGLGGNAAIYVRGGEPNSAKVLIDGMDVGNITDIRGGSYNFSGIDLDTLEQLTFLPGSRSAIHGSDALSGVISMSTMPADWANQSTEGKAFLQAGGGGLLQATLVQGIRLDGAYIRAGTSYTREDSWFEHSEFDAKRANLGVATRLGEATSLQLSGFGAWLDRSHLPDDSGGPLYAVWKEPDLRETEQYGFSLKSVSEILPDLSLNTHMYYYRFDEFVDSPGVAPGERDPFGVPPNSVANQLQRFQANSYLLHNPHPDLSVVYGVSWMEEDGESQSTVVYPFGTIDGEYALSADTLSAYMEAAWQVTDIFQLNSALRYDDITELDHVWTGRLESVFRLPDSNNEVSLSWGSGFKKPTFFALGNPVIGNPDLLPEESDLYEVSIRTRFPNRKLTMKNSLFRQEYNNLIDFSEAPPPRMVNLNEVISQGISSEVQVEISNNTRIAAGLTYLDMQVVDSDELLRNRPRWKAAVTIQHQINETVQVYLLGTCVSDRLDSSIPTGTRELDAYLQVNAGLTWKLIENLNVSLMLDNVLDEEFEQLVGFYSPGIRIRSKLSLIW